MPFCHRSLGLGCKRATFICVSTFVFLGWWLEPRVGGHRLASTLAWGALVGSAFPYGWGITRSDGASGAVIGLLAAGAVHGWRTRRADREGQFLFVGLGILLGVNLVVSFVMPAVDAAGHLGGALAGAVWGGAGTRVPRRVHGLVVAVWLLLTLWGFGRVLG